MPRVPHAIRMAARSVESAAPGATIVPPSGFRSESVLPLWNPIGWDDGSPGCSTGDGSPYSTHRVRNPGRVRIALHPWCVRLVPHLWRLRTPGHAGRPSLTLSPCHLVTLSRSGAERIG